MGKNGHYSKENNRRISLKNILLFIGEDYISHLFLNNFVSQSIKMGVKPILIFVRNKKNNASDYSELSRYMFYEKEILQKVLYPYIADNQNNIFKTMTPDQIVEKYNLHTIETFNVNDPTLHAIISDMDIIGAISVRCFQIFKLPIIDMIKQKGFFCNSHPGILPDYRGVYCLLRGLVNRENTLGWTMHDIDTGIDTGSVIRTIQHQNYDPNKPMPLILADTVPYLVEGWLDFIQASINNTDLPRLVQKSKGTYFTYPTQAEFDFWYEQKLLMPLVPKEMVKFYFDMFVKDNQKIQQSAIDFKVKLINAVAKYETMVEMSKEQFAQDPRQKAA